MPAAPSTLEPERPGQFVVECAALAFAPPDRREPPEWGEEHIQIPNSARGTKRFYKSTCPMMNEPLRRSVDTAVRRLVVLAPTGGGKTTLLDVSTPYVLANALGSTLMTIQGKGKADEYCEERLWPILDACPPVVAMKPVGPKARHLIKKDSRVYPTCSLFVDGDNKAAAQRRSVTFVRLDEVWLIKYGLIREFEARLHDRWNGQITLISQGAEQSVPDQKLELAEYWQSTDQAELHFKCPQCGTCQPYEWDSEAKRYSLRYEKILRADGTVDYTASGQTAHLVCSNDDCRAVLPDTYETRRRLAESLDDDPRQYVATASPEKPGYCGRHFNALSMYWVTWATLTVEWLKAVEALKDGDTTPMVIFVTKRLARTYWLPQQIVAVSLTAANYTLASYADGHSIDGEAWRFAEVDVQQDHYWFLIRAARADGSSRLLFADKVKTIQEVRQRQLDMKVIDALVYVDANYFPGKVYDLCAEYGWIAVTGEPVPGYLKNVAGRGAKPQYVTRYHSDVEAIQAPSGGRCGLIRFSRVKVTDETVRLRGGGAGVPAWEHGIDTSPDWQKHLVSETKVASNAAAAIPVFKYVKIKGRRNDLWWCEVAATLGMIIMGVLRPAAVETADEDVEANEIVDTAAPSPD